MSTLSLAWLSGHAALGLVAILAVALLLVVGLFRGALAGCYWLVSRLRRKAAREVLSSRELRRRRLGGHLSDAMERTLEQRVTETHEEAAPWVGIDAVASRRDAKKAIDRAGFEHACAEAAALSRAREEQRLVDEMVAERPEQLAGAKGVLAFTGTHWTIAAASESTNWPASTFDSDPGSTSGKPLHYLGWTCVGVSLGNESHLCAVGPSTRPCPSRVDVYRGGAWVVAEPNLAEAARRVLRDAT